ncbi:MAG: hypothetical protein M3040_11645 [Bacteroidota bacterium]|nr:hypothetical protein [Bacteroidota bacterium]
MTHKTNLRKAFATLAAIVSLLLLEAKRSHNRRISNKTFRNATMDDNTIGVSNTDYIFFQSLSKFLFIAVEQR